MQYGKTQGQSHKHLKDSQSQNNQVGIGHLVVFKGLSLVNSAWQQMCLFQQPSFKHLKILLKIQAEQDRLLGNLLATHTEKLTRNESAATSSGHVFSPLGIEVPRSGRQQSQLWVNQKG